MGGRIRSNFTLFFLYFHSFYFPIFYTETIFRKIIKKKKENEGKESSLFLGNYSRNKVI